jgi:hypothetical protein
LDRYHDEIGGADHCQPRDQPVRLPCGPAVVDGQSEAVYRSVSDGSAFSGAQATGVHKSPEETQRSGIANGMLFESAGRQGSFEP